MKKTTGIRIVLCLLLLVAVGAFLWKLWEGGAFVTDCSARYEGKLYWNGRVYVDAAQCAYTEGRVIAKTQDRKWTIHLVQEDPDHRFVVVRSFLDNYLLVAEDYAIPDHGRVTAVAWNGVYISDAAFLQALSEIQAQKQTDFLYTTEGLFRLTDTQRMKTVYFAYEDCPLATEYRGWLGKVDGQWVITTEISGLQVQTVGLYRIPEAYHAILEQYFFDA